MAVHLHPIQTSLKCPPPPGSVPAQLSSSPNATGQCQVECWHKVVEVELFYYELLKLSWVKVEQLENDCLRL